MAGPPSIYPSAKLNTFRVPRAARVSVYDARRRRNPHRACIVVGRFGTVATRLRRRCFRMRRPFRLASAVQRAALTPDRLCI